MRMGRRRSRVFSSVAVPAVLLTAAAGCATTDVTDPKSRGAASASTAASSTGPDPSASASPSPSASVDPAEAEKAVWWEAVVRPTLPGAGHVGNPAAFVETDQALEGRVWSAGLQGGMIRVVRDGEVIHEHVVGSVGADTPLPMASATKWFTAAVIMSLVEEGRIDLDAPISTYLAAARQPGVVTEGVKVRNLLTHTSGVRDVACQVQPSASPAACADTLLRTPLEYPVNTQVAYGNGPWHLVGLLVTEVTGVPFEELFRVRVAEPLGLTSSNFGGGPNTGTGGSLTTTLNDYSRFLEMIIGAGTTRDGVKVLSPAATAEMVSNQLEDHGAWIGGADITTGITEYGIGMWIDKLDGSGRSEIISGNASRGYYPWIDFANNSYGVLAVSDGRGAELAVPASQKVAYAAIDAARRY